MQKKNSIFWDETTISTLYDKLHILFNLQFLWNQALKIIIHYFAQFTNKYNYLCLKWLKIFQDLVKTNPKEFCSVLLLLIANIWHV